MLRVSARRRSRKRVPFQPIGPRGVLVAKPLPLGAPQRIEGASGQLDDVEGIGADRRVLAVSADRRLPAAVKVDRDGSDLGAALGPQLVKEGRRNGLGTTLTGPGDPPRVVADHAHQVTVALSVGHLVHADPHKAT